MDAPLLIIYHGDCPDGFGAAWWIGKNLGPHEKFAASYQKPAPDCTGKQVIMVDFCYPAEQLCTIALEAEGLTILDHHKTAIGYIADAWAVTSCDTILQVATSTPDSCVAYLDMDRSGVGLARDFIKLLCGVDAPEFLDYIEDRDLWRWEFKHTAQVFAAVTSRPHTDEDWNEMALMTLPMLVAEGEAIERYRRQRIEEILSTAFEVEMFDRVVWCVSCPYAYGSEVAGELALRNPRDFAAYYVDYGDRRKYGLRSTPNGADVSLLAQEFGGGGHKHASGFEIPFTRQAPFKIKDNT